MGDVQCCAVLLRQPTTADLHAAALLVQVDPVQLQILRMGLFELIHLNAPPHTISEHVDLAKTLVYPEAAGFTNGVHS